MKKLFFAAIACCAFIQSAVAIESPLNTSLIPFQSLVSSSVTQSSLSEDSFIVGFERLTQRLNKFGIVRYRLYVEVPREDGIVVNVDAHCDGCDHHHHHHHSHHSHHSHSSEHNHRPGYNVVTYIALFTVTPNPEIGPVIYTLDSIFQE